jgi:electron transfer flavoprotein alpha/beta subunit
MKEGFDMNIVVLVKQVPDPKGYVQIREDGTLDREKARSIINIYDRNALEAALQIKEEYDAKITAISMGPPQAEDVLKEAIAIGADEGILLSDRNLIGSDTLATSYALSKAIKKLEHFNLILCGMEATDGNTGQVGPEIAERLGISQVTFVNEFKIKGNFIEARRMVEGGHEWLRVTLPALLTITSTANEPRNTTFSGIIRAMKKSIEKWSVNDIDADTYKIGLKGSPTKLKKIKRAVLRRTQYVVEGDTANALIDNLLDRLEEDGIKLVELP